MLNQGEKGIAEKMHTQLSPMCSLIKKGKLLLSQMIERVVQDFLNG